MGLVPLVRLLRLAAGDEIGKLFVHGRVELRLLVVGDETLAALGSALTHVLHPLVAPLFEGIVVGDRALPERGLVVGERMGGAKEMLARADFAEGLERKRVVV